MGKKKSRQTTTAQYTFMTPPPNPYYKTAEQLIEGYDGGAGAAREQYGRNANQIAESGNDFFGPNETPEVRDRIKSSRLFSNNMQLGRNLMDAKQNEIAFKNAGYMSLGGATAPQLVQTGGTAYGEQWGSGLYSPLGQMGLQAGGSAIAA